MGGRLDLLSRCYLVKSFEQFAEVNFLGGLTSYRGSDLREASASREKSLKTKFYSLIIC